MTTDTTLKMRKSVSRICFVSFAGVFLLSTMLLSAEGGNVPIYGILAAIAAVEVLFGERRWTIIGVSLLAFAIGLMIEDYRACVVLDRRVEQVRLHARARELDQRTNPVPTTR